MRLVRETHFPVQAPAKVMGTVSCLNHINPVTIKSLGRILTDMKSI